METLNVDLGKRSYPIFIGENILNNIGDELRKITNYDRILIVTNDDIKQLYGEQVANSIANANFTVETFTIDEGEKYKTLSTANTVYDFLIKYNYTRQTVLVALGGGVVGDLAGFVAATYMRGIPFVQIPTTLLSMVDSSVGGKVAVNHDLGKNIIGAFYQPKFVLTDIDCLKTLAMVELRAGFAEVIKYGIIWDSTFFEFLDKNIEKIFKLDPSIMEIIIQRSCQIKAKVVEEDEHENAIRAILNYGHTIGHAIESLTNYKQYKHGEAVAIGMVVAAEISKIIGIIDEESVNKIKGLIKKASLPSVIPASIDTIDIVQRLNKDKKVKDGKVRFVLPTAIGKVSIRDDIKKDVISQAINSCR